MPDLIALGDALQARCGSRMNRSGYPRGSIRQYQPMDPAHPEALLVQHLVELIDEFIKEI